MEQLLEYAIVFILGWAMGSRLTAAWLHMTFREILKDLGIRNEQLKQLAQSKGFELSEDAEAEPSELPTLEVKIEQHGEQLFAFRKDTDQFLGQGTDREALILRLKENLTNVRLIIREEDGAELIKNG